MIERQRCALVLVLLTSTCGSADAGEIPGIPSQAPPTIERAVELNFSNDFLGRGGQTDDFRTQQISLTARFGERWIGLLDHSILTLGDSPAPGRLDQLSASAAYVALDHRRAALLNQVTFGGGLRSSGRFSGDRIQNGFHRLIGSNVEVMPYVDTSRTDLTAWVDAQRHHLPVYAANSGWSGGYWLRGSALVTSDGQWDSSLGAYAVANRRVLDLWFGLRSDWRRGYDRDVVQSETASAESDLAVVFGLRFGALILETVQQVNNEASYGQLKLISNGNEPFPAAERPPRVNVETVFLLPDVQLQVAGKFRSSLMVHGDGPWRESAFVDLRYGDPQYDDNPSLYVETRHLGAGLEWERSLAPSLPWIGAYVAVGAGWRYERLVGDAGLDGLQSSSVGRAAATAATGLRFNAASLGGGWSLRLQTSLSGWLPASDAQVDFDGQPLRIQRPGLALALGATFDYE